MSLSYSKEFTGDVRPFIDSAKRMAKTIGTIMAGDDSSGTFSGNTVIGGINGAYEVKAGVITITVNKKPFLVPESKIITALDKLFS